MRLTSSPSTTLPFLLCALLLACDENPAWIIGVESEDPPLAIHGNIVTRNGATEGWLVFHRGVIVSVGSNEESLPPTAKRLRYDGYIFPGLIDTHNHPQYNVIPKWRGPRLYANRDEWALEEDYVKRVRSVYNKLKADKVNYAALKYAEVRALIGGTTAIQGTYAPPEAKILVRNLGPHAYQIAAYSFDIQKISAKAVKQVVEGLRFGGVRRYLLHVAEGVDAESKAEFDQLRARGLLRSGVVLLQGVGLDRSHFRSMAAAGVSLVWSPSSNLALYGQTADVLAAREEGVTVALAPDWSVTGSDNLLEEMKAAYDYSEKSLGGALTPREIFEMVTVNAAQIAGIDGFLGELEIRHAADLFLAPKLDEDPFVSLLKTFPRHVDLVFVDGKPLYGDPSRLRSLLPDGIPDIIEVDGVQKALVMAGDAGTTPRADQRWSDVCKVLKAHMETLAPLVED